MAAPKMQKTVRAFLNPRFWVDALVVIAGYQLTNLTTAFMGDALPLPPLAVAALGPLVVIAGGGVIGGRHGTHLQLGAMVSAASTALGMLGIGVGA